MFDKHSYTTFSAQTLLLAINTLSPIERLLLTKSCPAGARIRLLSSLIKKRLANGEPFWSGSAGDPLDAATAELEEGILRQLLQPGGGVIQVRIEIGRAHV